MNTLTIQPEVQLLLENGAHLLVNVSGGADSDAMLTLLWEAHQQQRWPGRFLVIHAHLGRNEWSFTLPHIQEYVPMLTGRQPIIVAREAGDLLARWWQRYETLQAQGRADTVPPWSSSAARFCTSELKTAVIARWIRSHFPQNATIVSALGIRAEESSHRAKAETFRYDKKISAPTRNRQVYRWLPIHHFNLADVWHTLGWPLEKLERLRADVAATVQPGDTLGLKAALERWEYRWHPAYALGNHRVSCTACVMARRGDLLNGIAWQPDHFRDLVDLEIQSGFSFQPKQWLADLRPDLLTPEQCHALETAKSARTSCIAAPKTTAKQLQQLSLF